MKKLFLPVLCSLWFSGAINAQTVTWADHIAPILFTHCTPCHNPASGAAHSDFTKFSEAYNFSSTIDYYVNNKIMPPWPADPNYRHFTGERVLTSAEISLISQWVAGGALSGDTTLAPPAPVYHTGPQIANPGVAVTIPTYTVGANSDVYQCFAIPSGLTQDKYIRMFEVLPGNRNIVHHVLVYLDTTGAALQLDANYAGPGYPGFGGPGVNGAKLIGAWVPGAEPLVFPAGMGLKMPANSTIIMQVHYPAGTQGQRDSTSVRFDLVSGGLRDLSLAPALNHQNGGLGGLIDGPLSIPADEVKTFTARLNVPAAVKLTVLNVAPHMHLIGKSIKVFGVSPSGDTIPVIKIDDWNFQWQMFYRFRQPLIVEGGSQVFAVATYDNTLNNPRQPSNPPVQVNRGEGTTDEMMLVYITYTPYQAGDEDLIIDSTLIEEPNSVAEADGVISTIQLYAPVPNPAKDRVQLSYYLPDDRPAQLKVFSVSGEEMMSASVSGKPGVNKLELNTREWASGIYFAELTNGKNRRTKSVVVQK